MKETTSNTTRVEMGSLNVTEGPYHYVGLRRRDIQEIRIWRNAQIKVLRQTAPLGRDHQERWYRETVEVHHRSSTPGMLLVSMLNADRSLIGYGGLTNIDWFHRRAEISFLVEPNRALNASVYRADFTAFLLFLQRWAFSDLALNRLFTETYDFRLNHIQILEAAGMEVEGRLRQHIVDPNDPERFVDSILHGLTADRWVREVR
jgi:RimJ/RimL family protein N-acetyltransferase